MLRGRAASTVVLQAGLLATLAGLGLIAFLLLRDGDGSASPAGDTALVNTLAFSAGGSIYTVAADGSALREVIPGDRDSMWNASPALSPDGAKLIFVRDFDLWVANADGQDIRLLADVGNFATPTGGGASNSSLGAQSAAWSPDGEHIAYVVARISGSGTSNIWVMRPDGSEREEIYPIGGGFLEATWLDDEQIAAYIGAYEGAGQVLVFRRTGEEEPNVLISDEERPALTATRAADGRWLVGPFINEGPILYGEPGDMRQVAIGSSPALSPDGRSFAYFLGDTLRVASVDGTVDEQIVDLAPLGGRDRHFAEQPGCVPQHLPGCDYRPPMISWTEGR